MKAPTQVFEVYGRDTNYRISPNPDGPQNEMYKHGAVIVHDGDGRGKWVWQNQFFIGPDEMELVGKALIEAARITNKGQL